jgi:hypothetical protein
MKGGKKGRMEVESSAAVNSNKNVNSNKTLKIARNN